MMIWKTIGTSMLAAFVLIVIWQSTKNGMLRAVLKGILYGALLCAYFGTAGWLLSGGPTNG